MTAIKKTEEKVKTVVVSTQVNVKSLLKEATGTVVVLNKLDIEKKLKALVKSKKERLAELIEIPILDKKQFEELKGIEREFRENRYALQNVGKHNVSALNLAKKNNGAMLDELELIISPFETIAKDKRVLEEDRLRAIKEEEERLEQLRLEEIEGRIRKVGEDLEAELEVARKSKDWTKFDEIYKTFEDGLEELGEFEFEGSEVLDKYAERKKEVMDLIKQAEEQALKDLQLNEKEETLQAEKNKLETEKERMLEMFGIGFMFNGIEYFKGEEKFTQSTINEMTKEYFDGFVKVYKDEAEQKENELALIKEAKELGIEWIAKEGEILVDVLTKLIEEAKKTKTAKEQQDAKDKAEAKAKALKEVGKVVCDAIALNLSSMEQNIAPSELVNEEAKNYVVSFFESVGKEFSLLKSFLNQSEEEVEK